MRGVQMHAPSIGPYTWDDFIRLDEDDPRELIDGHLVECEASRRWHERIVASLAYHLESWVRSSGCGEVLASAYKVKIAERRGVMPDLQYHAPETAALAGEPGLDRGRPDLAVEIVSPGSSRYDRVIKLQHYASAGVPEYWLVDPKAHVLERLVLEDGVLVVADALEGDLVFRPASFPGLAVPLAELWEAHDRDAAARRD